MGEWKPCEHCTDPMDCGSWATCLSPRSNGYQHKPKPTPQTPPGQLAFTRIECRTCGLGPDNCRCHPGKYIVTCNPSPPDSWVRRKFEGA